MYKAKNKNFLLIYRKKIGMKRSICCKFDYIAETKVIREKPFIPKIDICEVLMRNLLLDFAEDSDDESEYIFPPSINRDRGFELNSIYPSIEILT